MRFSDKEEAIKDFEQRHGSMIDISYGCYMENRSESGKSGSRATSMEVGEIIQERGLVIWTRCWQREGEKR